jgi:hypothetical protein
MLVRRRVAVPFAGLAGLTLLGLGVVYLTVACESLPGFMGPHLGDTSPRLGLGIAAVVLGVGTLTATYLFARRHG